MPDLVSAPVARGRRSQAERREDTQKRLVEAAAALIHEHGYARLRTADVAERAGVSKGAQLHYFRTKQELVVATLRHVFEESRRIGRYRAEHVTGDVFEQLIDDAKEFFFSKYFLIAIDIVISASTDEEIRREVFEISRNARLPVEEAWRAALVQHGLPEEFAAQMLALTMHLVRGVVTRRLWDDRPEELEQQLALWREMIRAYLASQKAKAAG